MKVKDHPWGDPITLDDAIRQIATPYPSTGYGQLEELEREVSALREAFVSLAKLHIKSVSDLNALAGYDQFTEVTE
jgi:hypothetical protein